MRIYLESQRQNLTRNFIELSGKEEQLTVLWENTDSLSSWRAWSHLKASLLKYSYVFLRSVDLSTFLQKRTTLHYKLPSLQRIYWLDFLKTSKLKVMWLCGCTGLALSLCIMVMTPKRISPHPLWKFITVFTGGTIYTVYHFNHSFSSASLRYN